MTEHTTEPEPDRQEFLPYGRQSIEESDVEAVAEVLRSDWLTTGPKVAQFEREFASAVGATDAVALANGTAALHSMMAAAGIGPGDEVIVPAMTFASTANAVVLLGGRPVFCDVEPESLLIDAEQARKLVTSHTKAVVGVDYAGHPCDYDALRELADDHRLVLLSDACHAVGGAYKGRPVGSLADLTAFSFHPVKGMTTGEGGMVTTDDPEMAQRMRRFRNHGISSDHHARRERKTHRYEMVGLGYNYRLTEIQSALGINQLKRLPSFIRKRREIAYEYDCLFKQVDGVEPLRVAPWAEHAYHLYVVQIKRGDAGFRDEMYKSLHEQGIGVNVHYLPVYLHPYYRDSMRIEPGLCPIAEQAYHRILSLPIHPMMSKNNIDYVASSVEMNLEVSCT